MDEEEEETRTPVTVVSDKEATFIPLWEWSLSLRQVITVLFGLLFSFLLIRMISILIPVPTIFALILTSPIIIFALILAFIPKNGEPMEVWLTTKIEFWLSDRSYVLMEEGDQADLDFEDADWGEIDDRDWR